jgi:hypothetical protein
MKKPAEAGFFMGVADPQTPPARPFCVGPRRRCLLSGALNKKTEASSFGMSSCI